MKEFIGTCVNNPFVDRAQLDYVLSKGERITRSSFLKCCQVERSIEKEMYKRSGDFEFYRYRDIYFYRHSRIEHFYR